MAKYRDSGIQMSIFATGLRACTACSGKFASEQGKLLQPYGHRMSRGCHRSVTGMSGVGRLILRSAAEPSTTTQAPTMQAATCKLSKQIWVAHGTHHSNIQQHFVKRKEILCLKRPFSTNVTPIRSLHGCMLSYAGKNEIHLCDMR